MTSIIFALLGGLAIGLTVAFILRIYQAKQGRELAQEIFRETDAQRKADVDTVIDNVKTSFDSLSLQALAKATDEFLKLAKARLDTEREASARELDSKKGLIDQQLQAMTVQMEQVSRTINELEKDRIEKFGQLSSSLLLHSEQTQSLMQTANALRQALSSSKARGQWGERMAEDVLRLAGFIEGVNYAKQKTQGAGRPDYTFFLPQGLKVNMDVKFPLDNYMRCFEADNDAEKDGFKSQFLRDVNPAGLRKMEDISSAKPIYDLPIPNRRAPTEMRVGSLATLVSAKAKLARASRTITRRNRLGKILPLFFHPVVLELFDLFFALFNDFGHLFAGLFSLAGGKEQTGHKAHYRAEGQGLGQFPHFNHPPR